MKNEAPPPNKQRVCSLLFVFAAAAAEIPPLSEDSVHCPIRLKGFAEPVTTPCSHNFCQTCLGERWDRSDLCHCPVCNKRFQVRPEISTMEDFPIESKRRKVVPPDGGNPGEIHCDVCEEPKLVALKSCLTCLASYCEAHLELHLRVPSLMRHRLSRPVHDLEERICLEHHRLLELFCREDKVCICLLCGEADHKHHETVLVEDEWALQKETLESRKANVKMMIQSRSEKIQEFARHSDVTKEKTQKDMEESEALFASLTSHVVAMQEKLKKNIEQKLRKSQDRDKATVDALQDEFDQLEKELSELEDLSQSEDPLQILQRLQALDTTPVPENYPTLVVYSDLCVQTVRRAMTHLMCLFELKLKTLTKAELARMSQYTESVTFDPGTAGHHLVVTENGKRLKYSREASPPLCKDPGRFISSKVLGSGGFTSGRHYWEVQVGLKTDWDVGVAEETVLRTQITRLTRQNGCFAIGKRGPAYEVLGSTWKTLHLSQRPTHVGVYLDYDEGRVAFYDTDANAHIFTFTGQCFTEKMFPYFYLSSWAKKPKPLVIMS